MYQNFYFKTWKLQNLNTSKSKYPAQHLFSFETDICFHLFILIYFFYNKYYVMNYSINSFTGASEAPVNVVAVY